MPSFNFNPADSSAGFPVFDKGTYQIKTGEPKPFYSAGKDGKEPNYGVRFTSEVAEGQEAGKKYVINCYMHSEGARSFTKQTQMAILGFNKDQEKNFDAKYNGAVADWSANSDDGSVGSAWREMGNQIVLVELDVKIQDDEKRQVQKGIRPFRI